MRRLALAACALAIVGAGCVESVPQDIRLDPGDTVSVRTTVLGVGGKLTELVGVSQDEREIVVPDVWPDASASYGSDAFVFLPKSVYGELVDSGSSHISLGLFDETLSDGLTWIDRLNAIAERLGAEELATLPEGDPLRVELTDAQATDWVRYRGELVEARAVKAKNAFASYVILANPDAPLILSVTLTPLARAELDALSSFDGFEVSEIQTP